MESLEKIFSVCLSQMTLEDWGTVKAQMKAGRSPEDFPTLLAETSPASARPDFLPDLARLEWALYQLGRGPAEGDGDPDRVIVNPTLKLLQFSFKNLAPYAQAVDRAGSVAPEPGEELVLVWREPEEGTVRTRPALEEDLLVLKIVLEEVALETAAAAGGIRAAAIEASPGPGRRRGTSDRSPVQNPAGSGRLSSQPDPGPGIPGVLDLYAPVAHHPGLRPALQTLLRPERPFSPHLRASGQDPRRPACLLRGPEGPRRGHPSPAAIPCSIRGSRPLPGGEGTWVSARPSWETPPPASGSGNPVHRGTPFLPGQPRRPAGAQRQASAAPAI